MKLFVVINLILLSVFGCESDNDERAIDEKRINDLSEEIHALAESSVCNNETQCAYIAMGSKACGGSAGYLVYSNSIDTGELIEKVKVYNELTNQYNLKYGGISDCMPVSPPKELICEDNKCKAVY